MLLNAVHMMKKNMIFKKKETLGKQIDNIKYYGCIVND